VPTLGVVFRPQSPPERLRAVARAADAAGLAELWLWEDCFLEGGPTAATAALAWTERLHIGIGLLPVPLRNPALAAMEIATVAGLFPGRFLPGLGHGVLEWMGQVGARVPSPMTLLREHATAAGRSGEPFRTVVYVELDTKAGGLQARVDDAVGTFTEAGADTVVFQAPGESPDPEPLIEACAALS
jgi:alkanesulfonate monooxygenase SsuD/methylene tetrahydromethanopterin reductase-like flavin-dependent oxidoreductase (luciferase family)